MVFFVTLTIFPAITANTKPVEGIFSDDYFAPITTFLTFNLTALLGNLIASRYPNIVPAKYLFIPVTARLLFIPLFLECNFVPETGRSWHVAFNSDWVFWIFGILMGLTSGYFSSVSLMSAPKMVKVEYGPVAGMMCGFFVISGIFAGILLTFAWPAIVR